MPPDQTRERFGEIVKAAGGASAVAARLGYSANMVSCVVAGTRKPGPEMMRAIKALYGIPMEDWVDEPRLETVSRIVRSNAK
jgi:transcriptional regulator with XRE-family HTH domain